MADISKTPDLIARSKVRMRQYLDKLFTFGALILIFVVFSITATNFFSVRNILTMVLQTSTMTLMGIGVTMVIITGGIDLSVGSVVAISGTMAVLAANAGIPTAPAMAIGCAIGTLCGFGNGLLVTQLNLPPFIATLGSMMIIRGILLTVTNAATSPAPEDFGRLGNETLFRVVRETGDGTSEVIFPGISYIVIIMVIAAVAFHFLLHRTRIGRYTYAVGSNEEASRLSGIKVGWVKILNYVFAGFLFGLVGVILASRLVTTQPTGGAGYELNAIASAVIGGTSLMGGIGSVGGTVIGSFIIGVLSTGLTMQGANYFAQQIVIGSVVILAVTLDQLRHRDKK